MNVQNLRNFSPEDHVTWSQLFNRLETARRLWDDPLFLKGIKLLGIDAEGIPNLESVNNALKRLTGFTGHVVEGLEDGPSFFRALSRREFPIGNFIRNASDLNYTPAPDIFHDLYGHMPLLADRAYADFCYQFGIMSLPYLNDPKKLRMLERLFWFGVEFPLVETAKGLRIFGGGILSSLGESEYCLSDKPKREPFNVSRIMDLEFRIDVFQEYLFVLDRPEQLYHCLSEADSILRTA